MSFMLSFVVLLMRRGLFSFLLLFVAVDMRLRDKAACK